MKRPRICNPHTIGEADPVVDNLVSFMQQNTRDEANFFRINIRNLGHNDRQLHPIQLVESGIPKQGKMIAMRHRMFTDM